VENGRTRGKGSDVRFQFEDYALDTDTRELRRGAELISLAPKVFDLLAYLVRNRERVVSKDDLLEAVWHGRIVAESTLTSHINSVRKAVSDSGEEQRLIRTVARKGIRFIGEVRKERMPGDDARSNEPFNDAGDRAAATRPQFTLPDKPSIAVLPFQNMSGDPDQDYFADGVVEDIIVALSRMRWLFVIARNSSFAYKGRVVDVKQVAGELGVRYVLEGSVRKAANRVRITGQLIEASTGAHLWADRCDGSLDDIFDLQDQVTASVVGAIAPKLEQAEIDRSKRKPTGSLDAYDYFLRGLASYYLRTRDAIDAALRLFYEAIELDPGFASAYGMAAWCFGWRKINGWMADRVQEIAETSRLARRAAELGQDDAVALSRGAHALAFVVGDLDAAVTLVERALVLNPNLAGAWWASGWVRLWNGEPDLAIKHLTLAIRLSPLDPHILGMQAGIALSHLLAGRYGEALSWSKKALWEQTNYMTTFLLVAASSAQAGQLAEARKAMVHLRKLDPTLRVANVKDWAPFRRPEDLASLENGLRKAGLPE
jgi:TolB-like protein/tetratricopeptide (TPR) repeat protein